jgi:serine/threonine protein kinase
MHEIGETVLEGERVPYCVMEYLPGGSLMDLIKRRRRLSERETARIGADVAAGLAHAHERGIIHRDIKPQNILLDGSEHAKLADFRAFRVSEDVPEFFIGTPRYAAPECFRGQGLPASDVYSLGVVLYRMAVGELPFKGCPRSIVRQHASEAPVPPGERVWIGEELNGLILGCLEKIPSRRPGGAADLERRLRRISECATVRTVCSRRLRWWIRRHLISTVIFAASIKWCIEGGEWAVL